jgi:hypothetical protein
MRGRARTLARGTGSGNEGGGGEDGVGEGVGEGGGGEGGGGEGGGGGGGGGESGIGEGGSGDGSVGDGGVGVRGVGPDHEAEGGPPAACSESPRRDLCVTSGATRMHTAQRGWQPGAVARVSHRGSCTRYAVAMVETAAAMTAAMGAVAAMSLAPTAAS